MLIAFYSLCSQREKERERERESHMTFDDGNGIDVWTRKVYHFQNSKLLPITKFNWILQEEFNNIMKIKNKNRYKMQQ